MGGFLREKKLSTLAISRNGGRYMENTLMERTPEGEVGHLQRGFRVYRMARYGFAGLRSNS
jgi:hypothetical protein